MIASEPRDAEGISILKQDMEETVDVAETVRPFRINPSDFAIDVSITIEDDDRGDGVQFE